MREGSGVSCHFILSSCEHPKVEVCERLKKLEHSAQINQNGDVNRATVFIDFDHTLAHTTFLKWWERQAPEGRARFRHGIFNAATLLRPGAKELVTELSRDYQLVDDRSIIKRCTRNASKVSNAFLSLMTVLYGLTQTPHTALPLAEIVTPDRTLIRHQQARFLG